MSATDVLIARSEEALAHLRALYGENVSGFDGELERLEHAIEDAKVERSSPFVRIVCFLGDQRWLSTN